MMPGEAKEAEYILQTITISEGEMWGRKMKDINKWVDANGRLEMKFIIYYLGF